MGFHRVHPERLEGNLGTPPLFEIRVENRRFQLYPLLTRLGMQHILECWLTWDSNEMGRGLFGDREIGMPPGLLFDRFP